MGGDLNPNHDVVTLYQTMTKEHGPSAQGVGWRNTLEQERRFRLLMEGNYYGVKRMLDVGCGYGALVEWLERTKKLWFNHVQYSGIDVVPEFIEVARDKYPMSGLDLNHGLSSNHTPLNSRWFGQWDVQSFAEYFDPEEDELFDLVVCSGALTWHEMADKLAMLDAMWKLTRTTLAFNMRAEDAYLGDVSMILPRFGTSNYKITHNYGLPEMTVVVKK